MREVDHAMSNWFTTDEGRGAVQGAPSSNELQKRLELAFEAGWNARQEKVVAETAGGEGEDHE